MRAPYDHITTKPSQVETSLFINYFTKKVLDPSLSAKNTVFGRADMKGSIFFCPLPAKSHPRWASKPDTLAVLLIHSPFLFVRRGQVAEGEGVEKERGGVKAFVQF